MFLNHGVHPSSSNVAKLPSDLNGLTSRLCIPCFVSDICMCHYRLVHVCHHKGVCQASAPILLNMYVHIQT